MEPYVFDVDATRVDHLHLILVRSRNLYAKVNGVKRYGEHLRIRWTAISPVAPHEDDTGVLKVMPWESVPCVRRSDLALLLSGIGLDTCMPLPPPNGCRWCGVERYDHASLWAAGVGYHRWTDPGNELRKARMLARRARATSTM
ncbi:hypothetical protein [Nonomuraea sp. JJY05]|uniref:hypothetical protein n=1 Tax=Nonomuraea sp. JJY05 TaxID=3350255 RepID=UPI00373FA0DF